MTRYRQNIRLWAFWILASATLMMANPWGKFGWVELAAAILPLVLFIDHRISRESALAVGLPALTLLWLVEPVGTSVARLLLAWTTFGGGVILASRAVRSHAELESVAGQVAFGPFDPEEALRFDIALERELGRARRHERPFAVLSAAAHPRSLEADASGLLRSALLRSMAENRARLELRDFLRAELHVYSEVAIDGPRVLGLVPEVDDDGLALLLERLNNAADELFDFEVQIGASAFPRDGVCADDLIADADRHRTAAKLRSLPERVGPRANEALDWRSPDVQG